MSAARIRTGDDETGTKRGGRHPLIYVFGLLGFCTFVGVGYFFQLVNDPQKFPITKIAVDGEFLNVKPADVEALVSDGVVGGFFNLDVEHLQRKILLNPWIDSVSVRRIWPDSIRVSIREQDPVAYWGKHALLNAQADIFAPLSMPGDLPIVRLEGPIGTEAVMLEKYAEFQQSLDVTGIEIESLEMSERRSWRIETSRGVVINLGRDDLAKKIQRLKNAFDHALSTDWENVSMVDLRYTNGLTVRRVPAAQVAAG